METNHIKKATVQGGYAINGFEIRKLPNRQCCRFDTSTNPATAMSVVFAFEMRKRLAFEMIPFHRYSRSALLISGRRSARNAALRALLSAFSPM